MPILLLFLSLVLFVESVPAQELVKGMTMKDVISAKDWGVPERKMDYETSRRERWYYPDDRYIDFHEGVVASWKSPQTLSVLPDLETLPVEIEERRSPELEKSGTSVNAFLREVEKEGGEDGEEGSSNPRGRPPRRR